MLKLEEVSKKFGGRLVLDRVSLRLAPQQTHVLIGASGAGKTTLLRIVLGLDRPDAGKVTLDGISLETADRGEWARRIGYVPQAGGLFPHLTAAANVTLVAKTLGWSRTKRQARFEELRKIVDLDGPMLGRYPKELSGGQQQRVSIMRAAFLDPRVMILDEPLGALDPILRADLQDELKKIFNRLGKTVVLVTHDLGEAAFFGHTITLLNQARIEQSGPIEDFLDHPSTPYVSQFIGAQRTLEVWRAKH